MGGRRQPDDGHGRGGVRQAVGPFTEFGLQRGSLETRVWLLSRDVRVINDGGRLPSRTRSHRNRCARGAEWEARRVSRQLPGTDIDLSILCFGSFRLRPDNPGAYAALDAALEAGIDTIHSAPEYRSFELSRKVRLHPRRSDLHHIVKFPNPGFGQDRFDPDTFRRQVDDVLRALGAERIAVVQTGGWTRSGRSSTSQRHGPSSL